MNYFGKYTPFFILALLFGVIFFVYSPIVHGTFILDDYVWIQPLHYSQILPLFIGSWEHGNTLRPFMRLFFGMSEALFHHNAFGWHMVNISLHVLLSWTLYIILHKKTKNTVLAVAMALLFGMTPTHTEVVAWISGQTHQWGLLLSILSFFLFYMSFKRPRAFVYTSAAFVCMFVAFLTYEVSFILPIVLFFYILFFRTQWNTRNLLITGSTGLSLLAFILYRYKVLGNSIGSVGAHHTNIFLAPFHNAQEVVTWFFYTKQLFVLYALFGFLLVAGIYAIRNKVSVHLRYALFCFTLSVLAYLPFSIINGVAPRFLYSSIFFFILGIGFLAQVLIQQKKPLFRYTITIFVGALLLVAGNATMQSVTQYQKVSHAYALIRSQVTSLYPTWPADTDMLFHRIPNGIQDGGRSALAFLTYFDKAIHFGYDEQTNFGDVFRAEQLTESQMDDLLSRNPIEFKFIDFEHGVQPL